MQRPAIYFAGSIRGGRDDRELYHRLIRYLKSYGNVLTEHIGEDDISTAGESDLPDAEIYRRDLAWVRKADLLVAEVTTPSLGVGYEIGKAEELKKPVLCLYRRGSGRHLSAMIAGNEGLVVGTYGNWRELTDLIDGFFNSLAARGKG